MSCGYFHRDAAAATLWSYMTRSAGEPLNCRWKGDYGDTALVFGVVGVTKLWLMCAYGIARNEASGSLMD